MALKFTGKGFVEMSLAVPEGASALTLRMSTAAANALLTEGKIEALWQRAESAWLDVHWGIVVSDAIDISGAPRVSNQAVTVGRPELCAPSGALAVVLGRAALFAACGTRTMTEETSWDNDMLGNAGKLLVELLSKAGYVLVPASTSLEREKGNVDT